MLDEFTGDHTQSLQLTVSEQQIIQFEETQTDNTKMEYDRVLSQLKNYNLGVKFVKMYLLLMDMILHYWN